MPIIICLKEPQINLICEGDIKDNKETIEEYDALFPNLMVKDQDGHNMIIPLSQDSNIAFMKETTQEEIDKQREEAKKRRDAAGRGPGSSLLSPPQMTFPRGIGRRGRTQ